MRARRWISANGCYCDRCWLRTPPWSHRLLTKAMTNRWVHDHAAARSMSTNVLEVVHVVRTLLNKQSYGQGLAKDGLAEFSIRNLRWWFNMPWPLFKIYPSIEGVKLCNTIKKYINKNNMTLLFVMIRDLNFKEVVYTEWIIPLHKNPFVLEYSRFNYGT